MKPKVSVIVPVYNTEKYIERCLNSLVNQTLCDIEIICINDGSTDNSANIIKEFASKDKRIILINQQNKGQSIARNEGLNLANGEYTGFLDSDDYADTEMFEKLYQNAQKFSTDISMCSINVINEKTNEITSTDPYMGLEIFPDTFKDRAFTYKDCKDFLFRICVVPWNKLYKTEFLRQNKIKFAPNLVFEDNIFCLECIIKSEKISILKEPLVFYTRESDNSTTTAFANDHKKLDMFRVLDLQETVLRENGLYGIFEDYFLSHKKNTLLYWSNKIRDIKTKKEYKKMLERAF